MALASGRVMVVSVPVNTTILPASLPSAPAGGRRVLDREQAGEFVEGREVALLAEEFHQLLGDCRADADDVGEVAARLGADLARRQHLLPPVRETAVVAREQAGIGLADAADAERVDEARERDAAARRDRQREVARRGFAPALPRGDRLLMVGQTEDVGRAVQQAGGEKFAHGLLAEPVDVEGGAGDEVDQPLLDLRRAGEAAGAAAHHLAGRAQGRAAADRAVVREHVGLRVRRPLLQHRTEDLRDHVARALHDHGVADAHVLARDLVLVVQRGARNQHAADIHRLQIGDRRERAGAADLDRDVFQHRRRLLGGEFPRGRPARLAAGDSRAGRCKPRSSIL